MNKEEIREKYQAFIAKNPRLRKIIGIGCVLIGIFSLLTPLTPGSWLIFVGFEILGIRFLFWRKIKRYFFKKEKKDGVPD